MSKTGASTRLVKDSGEQTYTGTRTWTGTTAPSGTETHTYRLWQVGKLVTLRVNLIYGVAGSALSQLTMNLPAECPAPAVPAGYTTATFFYSGSGGISTGIGNQFAASRVSMGLTAGGVAHIWIVSSAINANSALVTISYFTNQ